MPNKPIKFSENFEVQVILKLECFDEDLRATLKFGEGKLPSLEIDSLSNRSFSQIKLSEHEIKSINCKSELCTYTLMNNESPSMGHIWSTYVIKNFKNDSISGIEIQVSGFSDWIDQKTHLRSDKHRIWKDFPEVFFDELIEINDESYRIRTIYNWHAQKRKDREFVISEFTTIQIFNLAKTISIDQAEKFAYDIIRLFSLLMAVPSSIESLWLIDQHGDHKQPFYFATAPKNTTSFQYARECLIQPDDITIDVGWKKLFDNYFSISKYQVFEKIWGRITPLFSYSGFWQYEFLGYVSILDAYCSKYAKKNGKKFKRENHTALKEDLLLIMDKHSDQLGEDYFDVINSFKEGIQSIKNTNLPTFKKKFDFMCDKIHSDIQKIINFSEDEFLTIKKIRDAAAHGLPIETVNGKNLTYEFKVKDKLLLLLLYLSYRDFGISPKQFAISMKNSLSKFIRNINIDSVTRDKLTGMVPFWEIDEDSFKKAKEASKSCVGIEFIKSSNAYRFSQTITDECQSWCSQRHPIESRNLIDFVRERRFSGKNVEIEYFSEAYLVHGQDKLHFSGLCKVTL